MNDSTIVNSLPSISLFILGEPASKANSRRVVRFGNMSRLIKSQKALNYSEEFRAQCPQLGRLMEGDLRVTMRIYYATRRPDLDESLILDLLQGVAYVNDRQVKVKHIEWGLDPATPRVAITVRKMTVDPALMPAKPAKKKRGSK